MTEALTILSGDCRESMRTLPEKSVHCCVTSPPYFGLRSYNGGDAEIGKEPTPDEYVAALVDVFREVRRVLRDDGVLFLNLGDRYNGSGGAGGDYGPGGIREGQRKYKGCKVAGLKLKDLIGIPWRVAFALQADGWWLRQDIIWHKPGQRRQNVKDRCTTSHEHLFVLTKAALYWWDHTAEGNESSVWSIKTSRFRQGHFATFPEELPRRCIMAGCPKDGIVLDPFMGAGTTALVALKAGRRAIGCELNPEYIEIANRRLKPLLTQGRLL